MPPTWTSGSRRPRRLAGMSSRLGIRRMAPIEFIGRYMPGWFDYAICDEIHQLAGDTAQGNALGTLASCTDRIVGLTGTLLGGYADDLFNTLFRLEARRMKEHGYEWGTTGRSSFIQDYGVLETITKVFSGEDEDKKIRALSGGEKSRLAIARMLYNPPNFNHLDLATKEMLVDALKDFEGTMIFVSHDRGLLRGLGSRVLELGGESGTDRHPTVYPGSYVEYVQKLGHEAPGIYS